MTKKERLAFFRKLGSKGGKRTAKKHGREYMIELAKKGAKKRWGLEDKVDF